MRILTRHSMAVEVVSYGLLKLMVRGGFLKPLAQVELQVLIEFVSCGTKKKNTHFNNADSCASIVRYPT